MKAKVAESYSLFYQSVKTAFMSRKEFLLFLQRNKQQGHKYRPMLTRAGETPQYLTTTEASKNPPFLTDISSLHKLLERVQIKNKKWPGLIIKLLLVMRLIWTQIDGGSCGKSIFVPSYAFSGLVCIHVGCVWECVCVCLRGVLWVRGIDESVADIWVWLRGSADTKSLHCSAVAAPCRSCTLQNNASLLMG